MAEYKGPFGGTVEPTPDPLPGELYDPDGQEPPGGQGFDPPEDEEDDEEVDEEDDDEDDEEDDDEIDTGVVGTGLSLIGLLVVGFIGYTLIRKR